MENVSEIKTCIKCGKEKEVGKFSRYFDNRDGKYYYRSKCKICLKEYQKKWYEDNKEWCKEYRRNNKESISKVTKLYREKYKDKYKKYMKQWYENNKDSYKQHYQDNKKYMSEQNKLYKRNNKFKINALTAKRRSVKRNQTLYNIDKEKINYMYYVANTMTKECGAEYQVDHIKPLSKGGLHHQDNLQILEASVNLNKGAKWPLTKEEKIKYKGLTLEDCKNDKEIRKCL